MDMPSNKRVVIGMSGGVDSSTAAALLQEQGWEVIGITLKLWPQNCTARAEDKCCGPQAATDARAVCHKLGIPFYLIDESEEFKRQVINHFAAEYRAGRTPNPCVLCNEKLKFGSLLDRARQLGADHVATGHYATIEPNADGSRMLLKRGKDPRKDQSYFLFSLSQHQLRHTLMPLGALTKSETREHARQIELKTADKEESMEICFVPDNDYGKFLLDSGAVTKHRGDIVDLQGKVLGHHDGIEFFTIGQRKGLGLSSPRPRYVVSLDATHNRVILGDASDLDRNEFTIGQCNWIAFDPPPSTFDALVKIRYQHAGTMATITPLSQGQAHVKLHTSQRAITPGQACVMYDQTTVLGGGWIMS